MTIRNQHERDEEESHGIARETLDKTLNWCRRNLRSWQDVAFVAAIGAIAALATHYGANRIFSRDSKPSRM